jgi:hypothetical protein
LRWHDRRAIEVSWREDHGIGGDASGRQIETVELISPEDRKNDTGILVRGLLPPKIFDAITAANAAPPLKKVLPPTVGCALARQLLA